MSTATDTALALAKNLQRLMDHHGLSQAQLSKKTGVGQSTLSNLLDKANPLEINPRASTVTALAKHFDVPPWLLLVPNLPLELLLTRRLAALLENYRDAPEDGRANIDRVADAEVRYARASGGKARTGTAG